MDDAALASLVKAIASIGGVGGIIAALIIVIYKQATKAFERNIKAFEGVAAGLDRVATRVTELDAREAERHAAVREDIAVLTTKVTSAIDWRDRPARSGPIALPDEEEIQRTPTGVPRSNRRDRG